MSERKAAIINVSKGLLNVSLTAIAAIGSATGNVWLAGATAIPGALAASGILKPLLEKQRDELWSYPCLIGGHRSLFLNLGRLLALVSKPIAK